MKNKIVLPGLALFQMLIIAGMLVQAMLPLLTGREIELPVTLRDPRDLFRGNYVALNYEINQINRDAVPNDLPPEAEYRYGDVLYLELKKQGRFPAPAGLWQKPPQNGVLYLRGIVQQPVFPGGSRTIELRFGIESYFTDLEAAKALEEKIFRRTPGDSLPPVTVTARVAPDGQARIQRVNYPTGAN